ncbi:RDD family protein [Apibacter raozihei]|uniref:RDD family protein n=1 Tax=Apibacter TaxID=1778601 RepID=UPI000FE376C3|nr:MULTISPECIES: RDD family protein [Apibacter]
MEKFTIVENNLAPKSLRFINYFIDYVVFILIYFILLIGPFYFSEYTVMDIIKIVNEPGIKLMTRLINMLLYALFMWAVEALLKGKSFGKFITGTKVVTEYGETPTLQNYLSRSFSRIVPFEFLSFFGRTGWHDKWSNTRVVKEKDFDRDMNALQAIDQIDGKENPDEGLSSISL